MLQQGYGSEVLLPVVQYPHWREWLEPLLEHQTLPYSAASSHDTLCNVSVTDTITTYYVAVS